MKKFIFIILLSSLCFGETFSSYPLSRFYVNLLSESGTRFLAADIDLAIKLDDSALIDQKKSKIRDTIIGILSSKTFEEVSTIKGKQRLKNQIIKEINTNIKKDIVNEIYFTNFVVDPRKKAGSNNIDDLQEVLNKINYNLIALINMIMNKN